MTAAGAALLMAPGIALADHNEFPDCDTRHYPPAACKPAQGGAGHDAPPLGGEPRDRVPPGTPVSMNATGCAPGAAVVLGLVRMSSPSQVIGLGSGNVNADANGAFDTTAVIPSNLADGTYVLFSECRSAASNDTIVSTSSFTVQRPAAAGSARTANSRTSTSSSGSTGASGDAIAITAADLPETWTPPASGWNASAQSKRAVTEAVNLRLASMRAALPAQEAPTAAPSAATATSTNLTPVYAAAGALTLVALGAAGYRRRAHAGSNGEVSA